MSILDFLTSLFAPDDCLSCGREGALLCRDCVDRLPAVPDHCYRCGQKVKGVVCDDCLPLDLHSVFAAAHYKGTAADLVGHLKFHGNQSAARYIAKAIAGQWQFPSDVIITHMPATTAHIRQRGYDQTELISRELSRITGLPRARLLRRAGQRHQLGASRAQRQAQLRGALGVRRGGYIKNKRLILVDDVLTTGSSIEAAASVLRQAGAAQVDAVVFAQAIKSTQ